MARVGDVDQHPGQKLERVNGLRARGEAVRLVEREVTAFMDRSYVSRSNATGFRAQ